MISSVQNDIGKKGFHTSTMADKYEELIWHVIFGAAPVLPRREEDPQLSAILRFTLDDATSLPLPDHSMLLHWQSPRKTGVWPCYLLKPVKAFCSNGYCSSGGSSGGQDRNHIYRTNGRVMTDLAWWAIVPAVSKALVGLSNRFFSRFDSIHCLILGFSSPNVEVSIHQPL